MRATPPLFAALLAVCCAGPAAAATAAADAIPVTRAAAPLPLDPALSDPGWQAGKITATAFTDLTTRRTAPVDTTAYVLYDDKALYVAFHAAQPGLAIAASQTTNGVGFGIDDFVGIAIDPSGGTQVYFFETTPRGTRYQQASENARYAPAWSAAARVSGDSWDAVMVIPLSALRLHAGTQHWRINLIRALAATGEHLSWAYDGLMTDGPVGGAWPNYQEARLWPSVRPFDLTKIAGGASRTPRADIYGLGSVGRDRTQFQQADQSFRSLSARPLGIDLAAPLTDTITFVGTLAPDFSNVEIDQQTIAPQEFRRALTEYRPFFAQGANFINPNPAAAAGITTPQNQVFYSPSIGPFDRGAKIEGTHGNDSFGVLNVRGYDLSRASQFDDVAFGYLHALPNRTFLYWADGVLAHHSAAGSDETTEFGVKGRNLKNGFVWAANTALEQGTARGGVEHSTNGFIDVHKPNYEVNLSYADISPHYNPLDGFTVNSDIRGPNLSLFLLGNGSWVKHWDLFIGGDRFTDRSGAVHQADTGVLLNANLKNGFSLNGFGSQTGVLRSYDIPAGPNCTGPILSRSAFTGAPCYLNGRTDRFNFFNLGFGYRDGTPAPIDWNYSFGPFGDVRLHQFSVTTSRPLAGRVALSLEYDGTWERSMTTGVLDSQFLRRAGLGVSLGSDTNFSVSLRSINGRGGFASPGTNLAATFHRHWASGNELYLDFGTPAATATLNRFVTKYVFHVGPLPGT